MTGVAAVGGEGGKGGMAGKAEFANSREDARRGQAMEDREVFKQDGDPSKA